MRPPAPCLSASRRAFSTCRPSCARPRHSVATAATSQPTTSPGELAAARRVLTQSIEAAAQREDYSSAAQLKRELEELNKQDPAWQLNQQLQECVREERFQEAARIKQQLKELEASLGVMVDDSTLSTSSDTTSNGIRVKIQSTYRPTESIPQQGHYFFSYHVVVTNESNDVVQLRHRHWVIRDANGKKEEVRGPGVVGVQPILLPGKSFEYDSACPLRTSWGIMEGEYEMWLWSEADGEFNKQFEAKIGRFKLQAPQ